MLSDPAVVAHKRAADGGGETCLATVRELHHIEQGRLVVIDLLSAISPYPGLSALPFPDADSDNISRRDWTVGSLLTKKGRVSEQP